MCSPSGSPVRNCIRSCHTGSHVTRSCVTGLPGSGSRRIGSHGSGSRRPGRRPPDLLAWLALAALGGCEPGSRAGKALPADPPPGVERIADSGLTASGVVDALDIAVTSDGSTLLAWQSRVARADPASPVVSVRCRRAGAASWDAPCRIPGAAAPLRLVEADGRALLLAGPDLRQWASADRDGTWSEVEAARPFSELIAGFDAVAEQGFVRVVAVVRAPGVDDGTRRLVSWTVSAGGPGAPITLGHFEGVTGEVLGPVLARRGGTLGVALGLNSLETQTETRNGRPVEVSRSLARVIAVLSPDGGGRWEAPVVVGAGAADLSAVTSVAIAGGPAGWTVACGAHGLLVSDLSDEGAWSPFQTIAAYEPGLAGGTNTTAVRARASGGALQLFWVDERNRRSDRRPWNPLGGFPWSDAPEWANNDLFMATRGPADTGWDLRRLTGDLSRTDCVAVAAGGSKTRLAWAGRGKVGKQPDSAGEAPALYVMDSVGPP